jgi:uncharacterized protein (TIGR02391 family)
MHDHTIQRLFPNVDDLLRTSVEQLAPVLLKLACAQLPTDFGFLARTECAFADSGGYPSPKQIEAEKHLARAWRWIDRKGLTEPSLGMNGQNGWVIFTEEGEAIAKGADIEAILSSQELPKALLHEAIIARCERLFRSGHYAEAVESGFKVVRDRLRSLTGHETGSDAFGTRKLHVKGAIAPHVDKDFNDGVKFLTMAIDKFRNEKAHTSEIGIDSPAKALQYLILSSLAMRLLDNAEIL